jgi:hypothetical protein
MRKHVTLMFALLLTAIALPAMAGMYWESEMIMKGAPQSTNTNGTSTIKTYHAGDMLRIEKNDHITIMKLAEGKSYDLDVKNKTYSELDLNKMFGEGEQSKAMQEMMTKMVADMKVEKTTETQEISGYKCTRYNATMMGTQTQLWVTPDVKGYKELHDSAMKLAEKFKNSPLIQNTVGIGTAMEKIDGMAIKTYVKMGTIESTNTVTKVAQQDLDKKLFEIPADYAKVETSFQKDMMGK